MGIFKGVDGLKGNYVHTYDGLSFKIDVEYILDKNNVIQVSDFTEFIDYVNNRKYWKLLCRIPDIIFELIEKMLNKMVQTKIPKSDISKIFTALKKCGESSYTNKNTKFEWVDIMKTKFDVIFTPMQKTILLNIGYTLSLKDILKADIFSQKEFDALFSKHETILSLIDDQKLTKEIIKKHKLKITNENVTSVLNASKIFYTSPGVKNISYDAYIFKFLNFLKDVKYNFNAKFMSVIFANICTLEASVLSRTKILSDMIGFFESFKIKPTITTLFDLMESSINSATIFIEFKYFDTITQDDFIMLMLLTEKANAWERNEQFWNALFKFVDSNKKLSKSIYTEKVCLLSIQINNDYMIQHIINNKYIDFVDLDAGFKYACINCNEKLVKYYLNQKVVPKIEHVYYLILNNTHYSPEITKFINMFIYHGLKMDTTLYEVVSLLPTQFELTEKFTNIDDKTKKIYNASLYIFDTIYNQPGEKKQCIKNKTELENLRDTCKSGSLSEIICYSIQNKIDLCDRICFDNSICIQHMRSRKYVTMFYMIDEYKFVPDLFSILKMTSFNERFIMMKLWYPNLVKIDIDAYANIIDTINQPVPKQQVQNDDNDSDSLNDESESSEEDIKPKKVAVKKTYKKSTKKVIKIEDSDSDEMVDFK